jgi:uncharacterized protein (TIGR00645 family)
MRLRSQYPMMSGRLDVRASDLARRRSEPAPPASHLFPAPARRLARPAQFVHQAGSWISERVMKRLEVFVESIILASRWLLVVFYIGLGLALALYALSFGIKLWDFASHVMTLGETETILKILALIDAALIASLVVMVIISGYENFVSRFDNDDDVHWLGQIDAGSLKIKVASTIVAISSIHLLQIFLNVPKYTDNQIMWYTILHVTFILSAFCLAVIDKIAKKPAKGDAPDL